MTSRQQDALVTRPSTSQGAEDSHVAGAQLRIRPLPWYVGDDGGVWDSEGRLVLSEPDDDLEAFIVHRVNAHDELVRALRSIQHAAATEAE